MAHTQLKYQLGTRHGYDDLLGRGGYAVVFKATEVGTGRFVALKKARAKWSMKRPTLRHETRVIQLLKGHPAIPAIYGYGHLEHFEYISMELLGKSLAEQKTEDAAMMVKTVTRVVQQVISALRHIHSLEIVHRDIKPDNFLCALDDPSRIKLIDFGISKSFRPDRRIDKYDPLKDRRGIVGTLHWASLNAHNGEDLAPRDDLESLALTALFLLRGNLPWKSSRVRQETDELARQEIVRIMKSRSSVPMLCGNLPPEFGDLLSYSRSLAYHQPPDYEKLNESFTGLAYKLGYSADNGPLDWTPCDPQAPLILEIPTVSVPAEDDCNQDDTDLQNSYISWTMDGWSLKGDREKDITLPAEIEVKFDRITPLIEEVRIAK